MRDTDPNLDLWDKCGEIGGGFFGSIHCGGP